MRRIVLLLLSFITVSVFGQITYYSNGTTTNFNTLSGWSINTNGTGANPGALNNTVRLIVQNGHSKITSGTATINQLTIQSGGTVTANNAITIAGTTPQFNINDGGTYIHNNNGTLSTTIFAGTETFGKTSNFQVNSWQSAGTSLTVGNGLNVSAPGTDGNTYYYGNLTLNWGGSGTWNQNWPDLVTPIFLTAGNWVITSVGTLRFSAANVVPDIYVYGNFSLAAGTIDFAAHNASDGGFLNVNGNITQTGGTITSTGLSATAFVWTYGPTSAIWTFSGGTRSWIEFTVTAVGAANKTVTLGSDFNLGTAGLDYFALAPTLTNLLVDVNTTFDAQGYLITYGGGNIGFYTEGLFRTSNANGLAIRANSTFGATGWYLVSGPGNTFEYYKAGNQYVTGVTGFYYNLKISGTGTKQLDQGNFDVITNFNFNSTSDLLDVANYSGTILTGASITGASSTSYFIVGTNGRIRQNNLPASARAFPIGTATAYLPATLTPTAAANDFSAGVYTSVNASITPYMFSANIVDAFWTVDRNTGSANLSAVRFDWPTALEGSNFNIAPDASINSYQSTVTPPTSAATWMLLVASARDNTNNYYIGSNVTTFGMQFVIGAGTPALILPLGITRFTGTRINDYNLLSWTMENADGLDRFEIERSIDGRNFIRIADVSATHELNYNYKDYIDNNITYYYRLKMVSGAGETKYSQIISIKGKGFGTFSLASNLVSDQLILHHPMTKNGAYAIYTTDGKILRSGRTESNAAISFVELISMPTGFYFIRYNDGNISATEKFMKK